jgi:hypothetical protein
MNKAPWIIILFLILVIVLQRIWLPNRMQQRLPETVYDTIHDTVIYPVPQYVPELVFRDTGRARWKWHQVDTAAILKAYYARHYYIDTLVNDSLVRAVVFDSVAQNQIIFREKQITVFPQKIFITKNRSLPRAKLYLGFSLGRNPTAFSFGPTVLFTAKKNQAYSLSYDLINKDFYFNIYWKLRFRK